MNVKLLKEIIDKGEGIDIEFKESRISLNKDVFETVCAFLNRNGGHLILGVKDNGEIIGVENPRKLIKDFITLANNSQKLNPPFYFSPKIFEINGRKIIYIYIFLSPKALRSTKQWEKYLIETWMEILMSPIILPLLLLFISENKLYIQKTLFSLMRV